eukprot:CAMPEP_0185598010 /NCGR_PEP_ID=MMETSP0434-20130131/81732_1 /TAXON_ID=626734 ORGANISM="Favella taraikaensis, Strain Fe Narragansett Bay" /NCGR_SAMPLE_ID=MMETSP0434 /ASSEMBLY_ACC=CAM_ASM_000379 /LENGTH=77 /DNA_ID=CAMNT_0028226887 /DNA_START=760 /DNA_END=993 /DNA_ORIENTATION=-
MKVVSQPRRLAVHFQESQISGPKYDFEETELMQELGRTGSPYLVRTYETYETPNTYYIIMEYASKCTLQELMARLRP